MRGNRRTNKGKGGELNGIKEFVFTTDSDSTELGGGRELIKESPLKAHL